MFKIWKFYNNSNDPDGKALATFKGLAVGLAAALALYGAGFLFEMCQCTCNILTCKYNNWEEYLPFLWSWNFFIGCLIFCVICGGIVGFVIGAENDHKMAQSYMQAAQLEEERKERERAYRYNTSMQICLTTLRDRLSPEKITPENADKARAYISNQPEESKSNAGITRDFALEEARKYTPAVEQAYNAAVRADDLSDAAKYAEFLHYIYPPADAQSERYRVLRENTLNLVRFIQSDSVSIITQQYGAADAGFVNRAKACCQNVFNNSQIVNDIIDVSELIWGAALAEPFDIYTYSAFISRYTKISEEQSIPPDALATMIYVQTKTDKAAFNRICPHFEQIMSARLSDASPNLVISMASLANWCNNHATERFCLELAQQRDFPIDGLGLAERLNEIRNNM